MSDFFNNTIKETFKTANFKEIEVVQSLWSGYGKLSRIEIENQVPKRIIAKHIILPDHQIHPRGWNTTTSHQRKIKSYQVETNWYNNFSSKCDDACKIPKHINSSSNKNELIILLEDLNELGFTERKSNLSIKEIKLCLNWLANFHALFMDNIPQGLWEVGTYWHLSTRTDEFELINDTKLKNAAHKIDKALNNCSYKTIVHGDAKVANFCFDKKALNVAAVDFQYVGGGCGIKDVVYLMGSCLTETECSVYESEILDYYFASLHKALTKYGTAKDFKLIEKEWRYLYSFAWTDFTRFLMGWMPTHQKLNGYSKKQMEITLGLI